MIIKIRPTAIIKSFAYVRASNARGASPNYASAYYVCDGEDDDVQIQHALSNFDLVVLSDGTFNISATLTSTKSLYGQGIDTTIIEMGSLTSRAIEFGGSSTQLGGNAGFNVVSAGSTTITTTSDRTSYLSAGDYFFIASNQNYNNERGQYTKAEWCQVQSISPTTITLVSPLEFTYESAFQRRIYKANLIDGIELQGFTVNYGTAQNTHMLMLTHCINASVRDVKVDGGATNKYAGIGIQLNNCIDSTVQNSIANNVNDTGNSLRIGYGFYLTGCYRCGVYDSYGIGCKHLTDADKANNQPYSQFLTFKKITAGAQLTGTAAPFSTHGGAIDVVFDNVYKKSIAADNEQGSFIFTLIRSVRTTFQNSELDAVVSNSFVAAPLIFGANPSPSQNGFGGDGAGVSNTDTIIRNTKINIRRDNGQPFTSTYQGQFIRFATSAKRITIENNEFSGVQNDGIIFEGNENTDITIIGNSMDFDGHRSGKFPVYVAPQNGMASANNLEFSDNTVTGANNTTAPHIRGTVAITNLIESGNNVD